MSRSIVIGVGNMLFKDEGIGIYFQMDEARPMFINTIPTIETFHTYRDL